MEVARIRIEIAALVGLRSQHGTHFLGRDGAGVGVVVLVAELRRVFLIPLRQRRAVAGVQDSGFEVAVDGVSLDQSLGQRFRLLRELPERTGVGSP